MNKKVLIIICIVVAVAIIGIGTILTINNIKLNNPPEKGKMKVTTKHTVGMTSDISKDNIKKEVKIFDIKLNEKIKIGGITNLEIEVIKIDKDSITIKTNQKMLIDKNNQDEFVVHNGETKSIHTNTMDAMDIFEFEINI